MFVTARNIVHVNDTQEKSQTKFDLQMRVQVISIYDPEHCESCSHAIASRVALIRLRADARSLIRAFASRKKNFASQSIHTSNISDPDQTVTKIGFSVLTVWQVLSCAGSNRLRIFYTNSEKFDQNFARNNVKALLAFASFINFLGDILLF